MDFEAFMEVLRRRCGNDLCLERGQHYTAEITTDDVIRILGEAPPHYAAYHCRFKRTAEGRIVCKIKSWRQDVPVPGEIDA